ncbi:MAG: hypothetical protein CL398_00330 [Acidiferrobacteraceae bacterium]|nr:hypothetical protein [Acidiferrobacteraceae bacterium]
MSEVLKGRPQPLSSIPVPINWLHTLQGKAAFPLQFIMVSSYDDEEPDAFYYESWNNIDAVGAAGKATGAAAGVLAGIDRYDMHCVDKETSLRYCVWAELYYEDQKPHIKYRDTDDDGVLFKSLGTAMNRISESSADRYREINKMWAQKNLAERWANVVNFEVHPTMDHSMGLTLGALLLAPWELVRETIMPSAPAFNWPPDPDEEDGPIDFPGFLGPDQCVMNFWGQDNDTADFFLYRLPTQRPV